MRPRTGDRFAWFVGLSLAFAACSSAGRPDQGADAAAPDVDAETTAPRDAGADPDAGAQRCVPEAPLATLRSTGDYYAHPRFSPDGTKVAVVAYAGFNFDDVLVLDRCGAVLTRLGVGALARASSTWAPAFSPDGDYVYFADRNGISRVSVTTKVVEAVAQAGGSTGFDVSRDGTALVFGDGAKIYLQSLTSTAGPSELDRSAGSMPRFSPSGDQVVFLNGKDVDVLKLAGRTLTLVASDGSTTGSAAWLPDDRTLVYTSTASKIMMISTTSTSSARAIHQGNSIRDLDVSRDGAAIAYGVSFSMAAYVLTGFH